MGSAEIKGKIGAAGTTLDNRTDEVYDPLDRPCTGELLTEVMASKTVIIPTMKRTELVAAIDDEIERLGKVRSLLTGHIMPMKRGMGPVAVPRKRKLSPGAREKIAAGQRKRWAKQKREG